MVESAVQKAVYFIAFRGMHMNNVYLEPFYPLNLNFNN